MPEKLNIFTAVNHVGNEHELLKLTRKYPVKFHYLRNNVRRWTEYSARPEPTTYLGPDKFEWVNSYEPGKYDLAILRVDQQHADPKIGKGQLYRDLNAVITDVPKIVVNHGTPMWDEVFTEDVVINGGTIPGRNGPKPIDGIKQLVGDNFMLVNSYTAASRWGWGYPVIHGLDANEWYDLPKEPRVVISLSPGGLDAYYNRQLLTYIKSYVRERVGLNVVHITVDWLARDWDEYRKFLAQSLLYVNPTKDSPMPRSRTEAMLSGCAVLTSRYHEADKFIRHGENGFIMPDNPLSYAEAISQLINFHYRDTVEMGQLGKQTAQKYFNIERYLDQMWAVITAVAAKKPPTWDGKTIFDD